MEKENKKNYLKYSPSKYMIKNPLISVHKLKDYDTEEDIYTFLLNYEEEGKEEHIVLGIIENTENLKENSEEVRNYICKQIEQNAEGANEFYNLERLINEINNKQIPFKFTLEGVDVLLRDSYKCRELTTTYSVIEDETGKVNKLKKNFDLGVTDKIKQDTPNIMERIKWARRRKLLLDKMPTSEKELFLKGENIKKFTEEKNLDVILEQRRNIIVDYLMQNYPVYDYKSANKEEDNTSILDKYIYEKQKGIVLEEEMEKQKEDQDISVGKQYINISNEYLNAKEKGVSIDAKIILEKLEDKLFEKYAKTGETHRRTISTIQNYEKFFELLKTRRDFNARYLALQYNKIDFSVLRDCFEKFSRDEELKVYLDKKIDYIKDIQLEKVEDTDYKKNMSVSDLYDFLAKSSTRKFAKKEEDIALIYAYESLKKQIIFKNIEAVEKYNEYADKSGFGCEIPNEKRRSLENIPESAKEFYETENRVR